jgi:hypothetical protein
MKAIEFPGVNVRIAEDQPEYQTLPARVGPVPVCICPVCDGKEAPKGTPEPVPLCEQCGGQGYLNAVGATFCFELTPEEITQIISTGKLWHTVLTFGQPLQPQRMEITKPLFLP